jgi:putative holliday junction resolvase
MSKYLGIDYGSKRIGIAVSDEGKKIAFPRKHIINNENLFFELIKIIKEEDISNIIIGYPENLKSEETNQTLITIEFRKKLVSYLEKENLRVKIDFFDERFTSKLALQKSIESIPSRKKRMEKGITDSFSAQIILQDFIDKNNKIINDNS